ncbi:MAG: hypothetical protein V7725_04240 [Porticoccus sp.]
MWKSGESSQPIAWLAAGALLLMAALPVTAAAASGSDKWEYETTIYLWGAGLDATTQTGDEINISISDILSDLDLAFMGGFGARKGKWSLLVDAIYLDMSQSDGGSETIPILGGTLAVERTVDMDIEMKALITTFGAGYNVVDNERTALDLVGGARYTWVDIDTKLDLTLDGQMLQTSRQEEVSDSQHLWDGIVGVKGQINLSNNWYLPYYADIGTGDSDFTWQAMAGVGYTFKWGHVLLAYRYLDYKFDSDFLLDDMTISGPALGARFRF